MGWLGAEELMNDDGAPCGTGVGATIVLNPLCRDLEISGEADSLAVVVGWELDCMPAND